MLQDCEWSSAGSAICTKCANKSDGAGYIGPDPSEWKKGNKKICGVGHYTSLLHKTNFTLQKLKNPNDKKKCYQ